MTSPGWTHFATVTEEERIELSGCNLWDYAWRQTGETININDPIYRQQHTLCVYEIFVNDNQIIFAAGEFSNGVWGFYRQQS